jgi:hypothetical protein
MEMSILQVGSVPPFLCIVQVDLITFFPPGAFALFGPGQFSNLYPEVTKPVGGLLHFAGEAASVHHA